MTVNPIAPLRRLATLGVLGALGLVGAKSWLDEGRANLRLAYYRDLAAFHSDAGLAACVTRDAVVDAAMRQRWLVSEAPRACGVGALRVIPDEPTPWRPGPEGFVVGFDTAGCRVEVPLSCTE